jgi:bifunctional DNase/RNase
MAIKMRVSNLAVDPQLDSPVLILKDEAGETLLPIFVGLAEATAIATQLEDIEFPRPMTHDLLMDIIGNMGGSVDMIELSDLRDDTFYADIHLDMGKRKVKIDARPSDAIALALRAEAPIFVKNRVLEKSLHAQDREGEESEEARKLREMLESLDPKDFGKYKM